MAAKPGFPEILAFGPTGYGDELLWGAAMSISIALLAYSLGLIIGIIGALCKLDGSPLTRGIMEGYTTLVRAVPELILILILYYAGTATLNQLLESAGYETVAINGFVAAIQAIPVGQMEAAKAYGMSPWLIFRRITLPSMLPYAIPGLANLWLIVTKDTALIAVVGYTELALATRQAAGNTKMYFTFFMVAGLIYLIITLISQKGFAILEKRVRRGQRKLA